MKKLVLVALLSLLASCAQKQFYENHNPTTKKIAHAIPQYQRLSTAKWPAITSEKVIKPGSRDKAIPFIRNRLLSLGDLKVAGEHNNSEYYDKHLVSAVKIFQKRHGLPTDAIIGQTTLNELNTPPSARLSQLQTSLQEWQHLPFKTDTPYILINIPSYELKLIKDNETQLSMKVVVGAKSWPTPTLTSAIQSIVINPKWSIPTNIVEKEIINKVIENPAYLSENNIIIKKNWDSNAEEVPSQQIDWHEYAGDKDLPYVLIQNPGDHNALGRIKFTFPNKHHIYLHDTPHKEAFKLEKRNLSHGCIRLEKPFDLLAYLLKNDLIKRATNISEFVAGDTTKHFALKNDIPIYITNIPSWVGENDEVYFAPVS